MTRDQQHKTVCKICESILSVSAPFSSFRADVQDACRQRVGPCPRLCDAHKVSGLNMAGKTQDLCIVLSASLLEIRRSPEVTHNPKTKTKTDGNISLSLDMLLLF